MTLYNNYILRSISQNPFRILGVTTNASKKDIIANVNKFKAFLKVGKHINGSYRIAASVSASNVSRYAGTESLNGGSYEVEYYISTTTVPSYRHY